MTAEAYWKVVLDGDQSPAPLLFTRLVSHQSMRSPDRAAGDRRPSWRRSSEEEAVVCGRGRRSPAQKWSTVVPADTGCLKQVLVPGVVRPVELIDVSDSLARLFMMSHDRFWPGCSACGGRRSGSGLVGVIWQGPGWRFTVKVVVNVKNDQCVSPPPPS